MKTFTISLPAKVAKQIERIAKIVEKTPEFIIADGLGYFEDAYAGNQASEIATIHSWFEYDDPAQAARVQSRIDGIVARFG